MPIEENPHAGQGPVVLDIGGDIGALIVTMPAQMDGLEVEIIPTGTDTRPHREADPAPHEHHHGADEHHYSHGLHSDHDHDHDHDHDGITVAPPHVAVVARPAPDGSTVHSLVYAELREGTYDLYVRPNGPVRLTATVTGGQVSQHRWPDWEPLN